MSGEPPASKTTTPSLVMTTSVFPSWGSSNGSAQMPAHTDGANCCQLYWMRQRPERAPRSSSEA